MRQLCFHFHWIKLGLCLRQMSCWLVSAPDCTRYKLPAAPSTVYFENQQPHYLRLMHDDVSTDLSGYNLCNVALNQSVVRHLKYLLNLKRVHFLCTTGVQSQLRGLPHHSFHQRPWVSRQQTFVHRYEYKYALCKMPKCRKVKTRAFVELNRRSLGGLVISIVEPSLSLLPLHHLDSFVSLPNGRKCISVCSRMFLIVVYHLWYAGGNRRQFKQTHSLSCRVPQLFVGSPIWTNKEMIEEN